jgi:hypothetical protein
MIESRRIRVEIRRVFLQVWDPIGVREEPNAQDEYDGYLGNVYELLIAGSSDECIAQYLCSVVTERIELRATVEDMADTVAALRDIQVAGN